MFGEIIVGEGSPAPAAEESTSDDAEDTPGFLMTAGLVALLGAAMVAGRRDRTA
jgi:MYXO-CTERM domain-containing protein